MDKKRIKKIVDNCNLGVDEAENEIRKLSPKEIIELKAKLRGRSTHYDKWILMVIPFITLAITVLSTFVDISDSPKNRFTISILILICALLTFSILIYAFHIKNQMGKEKDIATLSYLEDFTSANEIVCDQNIKIQKDEGKQILEKEEQKETTIDKQNEVPNISSKSDNDIVVVSHDESIDKSENQE